MALVDAIQNKQRARTHNSRYTHGIGDYPTVYLLADKHDIASD